MCGFLLHVEKVGAFWLLCSTEPIWQEEIQLLPWCDVSIGMVLVSVFQRKRWVHCVCVIFRDLMDRLVDEAEGLAVDGSSPVCSAGAGGRLDASAEQQLGLLNSITASDLTGNSCLMHNNVFLSTYPGIYKLATSVVVKWTAVWRTSAHLNLTALLVSHRTSSGEPTVRGFRSL